jgi:hypothetical protein
MTCLPASQDTSAGGALDVMPADVQQLIRRNRRARRATSNQKLLGSVRREWGMLTLFCLGTHHSPDSCNVTLVPFLTAQSKEFLEFIQTREHRAPQNLRRHSSCSESPRRSFWRALGSGGSFWVSIPSQFFARRLATYATLMGCSVGESLPTPLSSDRLCSASISSATASSVVRVLKRYRLPST